MVQRRPSYVVGFVLAMLVLVAVVVVALARDDDDAARRPAVVRGADLKVLDSRGQPLRTSTRVRFAISYGTCDGTNAAEAPDADVRLRVRIDVVVKRSSCVCRSPSEPLVPVRGCGAPSSAAWRCPSPSGAERSSTVP